MILGSIDGPAEMTLGHTDGQGFESSEVRDCQEERVVGKGAAMLIPKPGLQGGCPRALKVETRFFRAHAIQGRP